MPAFSLEKSVLADHTMLALIGDVGRGSAAIITSSGLAALVEPGTRLVVVDLARVTSMNSVALRALIELRTTAGEVGIQLLLSHLPDRVQRLLDIVDPWAAGTGFGTRWIDTPGGQARCDDDVEGEAGRCQLIAGHDQPHAASVGDAYLTWGPGGVRAWSVHVPPAWLTDLAWVAVFRPRATAIGDDLPIVEAS